MALIGIEKIEEKNACYDSPYLAKEHVYRHRNIFSKSTRRYIEYSHYPVVIKEIDRGPGGEVRYWYWIFKRDGIEIWKFDRKPTKKEASKLWTRIREIYEARVKEIHRG